MSTTGGRTLFRSAVGIGALLLGLGCAGERLEERESATERSAVTHEHADDAGVGSQRVVSASGTSLLLRLEPEPPVAGDARLVVSIEHGTAVPHSLDLVAPSMPMHGIARYVLERTGDLYQADITIPMEGDWSVWVNFDDGTESAEVRFIVGNPEHPDTHH